MTTQTARRAGKVIAAIFAALIFAFWATGYATHLHDPYPTQQEQR